MSMSKLMSLAGAVAITAVASAQTIVFDEVAREEGLELPLAAHSPGCAVGDYNGDGWMDVAVFGAADARPQIFRNNGDMQLGTSRFTNVSAEIIPQGAPPTSMGMFADLDHDGDQDLLLVRRYVDPETGEFTHMQTGITYLENRNGRYALGPTPEKLGKSYHRHGGLALADLDNDSDLDAVFVHNKGVIPNLGGPGVYIRNDGLPRLVDATSAFGANLGTWRRHFTVILADFTGDMLPDMHNAIDFNNDYHAENLGNGSFLNVSTSSGAYGGGSDMGIAVGDVDNDGDLDMYATNINIGVLHINDGAGNFTNEAHARNCQSFEPGLGITTAWGTAFGDFDLDGDLDLVAVGYGSLTGSLFKNDGAGYFSRVTTTSGMVLSGHGLIAFDYDRDGREDIMIMHTGINARIRLFKNVTEVPDNHWLNVTLIGTDSNTNGVGAKVTVTTAGGSQMRMVVAGSSYRSGPPINAHFGLGTQRQVQSIEVHWPSGTVQMLGPLPADQYLTITEQ